MDKCEAKEFLSELVRMAEKYFDFEDGLLEKFEEFVKSAIDETGKEALNVDTPSGKLSVGISAVPCNPGVYVELYPKGCDCPIDIALVEHSEETSNVTSYIWGDAMDEDWTQKIALSNLDKCVEVISELDNEKE